MAATTLYTYTTGDYRVLFVDNTMIQVSVGGDEDGF